MTNQNGRSQKTTVWARPLLFIIAALYLCANLFASPNIPIFLEGDQTFFWVYAQRILHGERIYQDFFQFTPPGADLLYYVLFRIFGIHLWVTNLAVLCLGLALSYLCFDLASRFMKHGMALLTSVIFLVLIYGSSLDATHHWFSILASLSAIRILMSARTFPRIAGAGALLGLAMFFTQTNGVAASAAVLLALVVEDISIQDAWKLKMNRIAVLMAAISMTWCVLISHWIAIIGWRKLWYFEITYPVNFIRSNYLIPKLSGSLSDGAQRLLVYASILLAYPGTLWYCWHRRRNLTGQEKIQATLLTLTGLFLFLGVITKVSWIRLYIVSMPAIVVCMWAVAHTKKVRPFIVSVLWILIAILATRQTMSRHRHANTIVDLPAGTTALSELWAEKFVWITEHTHPGDLFLEAQRINAYLPLQLHSPIFADGLLSTEVTRPEYVELAVRQVEQKRVHYILWSPQLSATVKGNSEDQNNLGPFRSYLSTHYTRVHIFSNEDEIWERR
jgi:hypothetical protein